MSCFADTPEVPCISEQRHSLGRRSRGRPPGSNLARKMVRWRHDEGETGVKKDQSKFHETMHDRMDPAGQISVPLIFDLLSAEELDASLAPTGLLPLVALLMDLQTWADAVSSSEVALVKHLFGLTDPHVVKQSAEASTGAMCKRNAVHHELIRRDVELRNTLKNLAQAHPGEFQVPCDIDCRSYDETHQLRESWHALVKVVGCTGTTNFAIQKNSPTMPQVVQKSSATCTHGALERQCPSLYSSIQHVDRGSHRARPRSWRQPRATRRGGSSALEVFSSLMPQQRQENLGIGNKLEFGRFRCGRQARSRCSVDLTAPSTTPLNGRGRSCAQRRPSWSDGHAVTGSFGERALGRYNDGAWQIPFSNSASSSSRHCVVSRFSFP